MIAVAAFDRWVDDQLERLRGHRLPDVVFSTASTLGDFSLIWHVINATRCVIGSRRADQAIALTAVLGVESVLVNQGVKRLFRRTRPTETGDRPYAIRTPSTSSFPSGHASSAFAAATLLTRWDGRRSAGPWFALASIVATSRAYVRVHHPSDVIGGALLGLALGRVAVRAMRRVAPHL